MAEPVCDFQSLALVAEGLSAWGAQMPALQMFVPKRWRSMSYSARVLGKNAWVCVALPAVWRKLVVPSLLVALLRMSAKATGNTASALCCARNWSASALSSWSFTQRLRIANSVAMLASASMTIKVGSANPLMRVEYLMA